MSCIVFHEKLKFCSQRSEFMFRLAMHFLVISLVELFLWAGTKMCLSSADLSLDIDATFLGVCCCSTVSGHKDVESPFRKHQDVSELLRLEVEARLSHYAKKS